MGFFDFLEKSKPSRRPPRHRVTRSPRRREAARPKRGADARPHGGIQQLADMMTPDAAAALLKRFTSSSTPAITDQREGVAFQGDHRRRRGRGARLARPSAEGRGAHLAAQDPRTSCSTSTRTMSKLLEQLERSVTEYSRDLEPKLQVIQVLEEVISRGRARGRRALPRGRERDGRFHAVRRHRPERASESLIGDRGSMTEGEALEAAPAPRRRSSVGELLERLQPVVRLGPLVRGILATRPATRLSTGAPPGRRGEGCSSSESRKNPTGTSRFA